jgi:hypothetical protein
MRPCVTRLPITGIENDGRAAFAGAVDVKRPAADVDRAADLWKALAIPPSPHFLIHEARRQGSQQRHADALQHELQPPSGIGMREWHATSELGLCRPSAALSIQQISKLTY